MRQGNPMARSPECSSVPSPDEGNLYLAPRFSFTGEDQVDNDAVVQVVTKINGKEFI